MSTVVNRSTLVVLYSVNTPSFPPAAWLINPPGLWLLLGLGVPVRYWKVDDDDLVEQDAAERAATDRALLPQDKEARAAAIAAKTLEIQNAGIEYPGGSGDFYTLSPAALKAFQLQASVGSFPFLWHSIDYVGALSVANATQADALLSAAANKLRAVLQAGEDLLQLVRMAPDKAVLDAIIDPR